MLSISNFAPVTRRLLATAALAVALVGTLTVATALTDSTVSNLAVGGNPIKPKAPSASTR